MRFVRAAASEVIGLFVGDWLQSIVVLAILAAGWFAFARFGPPALAAVVVLLAAQVVWFANVEARRSKRLRQPSPS